MAQFEARNLDFRSYAEGPTSRNTGLASHPSVVSFLGERASIAYRFDKQNDVY